MKRSKHNLSNYKLLTADMGQLVPCGLAEVLPGDTFQHRTSMLVRLSPLAAPVMHPVSVRLHHFFVPNRLVNENWEDFITGGPDGKDASTVPQIDSTGVALDLLDYLGIPQVAGISINAMPIRAYNLIYNEWFRDQDLHDEREAEDTTIARVGWEKDYFTASRPWPQKGDEVLMPIGERAPVTGFAKENATFGPQPGTFRETDGKDVTYAQSTVVDGSSGNATYHVEEDPDHPGYPNVWADLATATGVNVRDVRLAFAIQRFQEARSRYGSRYTEYLRYLGVKSSDARLQRPEYLGGGRVRVSISEVLQTAPETGAEPTNGLGVGDMYGHGITAMRGNRYRRFFEEHGYVLSLMSVRPKAIYEQGIDRTWLRKDKEDYFQKELQFIGQQAVLNQEIYGAAGASTVWGYQDRYADYRQIPSKVAGEFRDILNYWHLARQFQTAPALNASFIDCNPSKRIFNEQTQHSLWIMAQHKLMARRLVSRNASGRII